MYRSSGNKEQLLTRFVEDCGRPYSAFQGDQRWSEVVPPQASLTFAVVWDPEGDTIAFFEPELLETSEDGEHLKSPIDVEDSHSQVLTIQPSCPMPADSVSTLGFFYFTHEKRVCIRTPLDERMGISKTRTSSTLGGLDVYLRGSVLGKTHVLPQEYSCLESLDSNFQIDPLTTFAKGLMNDFDPCHTGIRDSGLYDKLERPFYVEVNEGNLCSAFSTTTTSTSNYITVENDDDYEAYSTEWSTLEPPRTPGFMKLSFCSQRQPKRLRKRRPKDPPASPDVVLQRAEYNHEPSYSTLQEQTPIHKPNSIKTGVLRRLGSWKICLTRG